MKKRIQFLIVTTVMLVTLQVKAQVGIEAGFLNSNTIKRSLNKEDDPLNGFKLGVTYDMKIKGSISLKYALNYSRSANRDVNTETQFGITKKETTKYAEQYLNLPVQLAYSYLIAKDINVFGFAGPSFVYALSKRRVSETTISGYPIAFLNGSTIVESNLFKDALTKDSYSRFDIQLGIGAGVDFKNIRLKAGYGFGMLNQYKGDFAKKNLSYRYEFSVTLGYLF